MQEFRHCTQIAGGGLHKLRKQNPHAAPTRRQVRLWVLLDAFARHDPSGLPARYGPRGRRQHDATARTPAVLAPRMVRADKTT